VESLPACLPARRGEKKKMRRKMIKRGMSDSAIAGIDLGGSSSLATTLSPGAEIAEIEATSTVTSLSLPEVCRSSTASVFEGIYVAASSSKQMAKKKVKKPSRKAKKTNAKRRVIKKKEVTPPAAAPATTQLATKSRYDVHLPYR
jgi:hypothetical protein